MTRTAAQSMRLTCCRTEQQRPVAAGGQRGGEASPRCCWIGTTAWREIIGLGTAHLRLVQTTYTRMEETVCFKRFAKSYSAPERLPCFTTQAFAATPSPTWIGDVNARLSI